MSRTVRFFLIGTYALAAAAFVGVLALSFGATPVWPVMLVAFTFAGTGAWLGTKETVR